MGGVICSFPFSCCVQSHDPAASCHWSDARPAAIDEPGTLWHASHREKVQPWRAPLLSGCVSQHSQTHTLTAEPGNISLFSLESVCLGVSADEENESSSSEEEEVDRRRLNDQLLGKICSVEDQQESGDWYLALV